MSGEVILVSGPALRVAIVGVMLSQRWLGPGRKLVLAPDAKDGAAREIVARPDHMRFHSEIGCAFEGLTKSVNAKPLFAPTYSSASGDLKLPFAPIGQSRGGVEFQHYWMRSNAISKQPDLLRFAPAIALEEGGGEPSLDQLQANGLAFGLRLPLQSYAEFLVGVAKSAGAEISSQKGNEETFDLVFDCSGDAQPSWVGKRIAMLAPEDLPGLEWQLSFNAARRFLALSAEFSSPANEQREYTRLAQQEADRIADMRALLQEPAPSSTSRETLQRKTALFAACGRIPTEDFEVFSPPEWLAALWGRGLRPRRYDRMANLMAEEQLLSWMDELKRQCDTLSRVKEVV